jgi:ElaB/YqjD/DUF883 family membrane-anchored ribosome-binding protein
MSLPLQVEISQKGFMVIAMKTTELTDKIQDWQKSAMENARNIGQETDEYIRDHTWTSIALAAVAGCVVGLLLGRRHD